MSNSHPSDPTLPTEEKNIPQKKGVKKNFLFIGASLLAFVFVLVVGYIAYIFLGPKYGPIQYGICKVFAERYIDFPTTMKVRDAEYYGRNIRIFVSHQDSSGQFNYNVIECEYGSRSLNVTRIRIDRRLISDIGDDNKVNPDILNSFNKGIPAIIKNPPDLKVPRSTRNMSLNELWAGDS